VCPVCDESAEKSLIIHLAHDHNIFIENSRRHCTVTDEHGVDFVLEPGPITWARCLCGAELTLDEFYEHVGRKSSPCKVLYLLSRGD
jgi:hypothetical protein